MGNRQMKVLVTGAAGYIGQHTVLELSRQGYSVVGLDRVGGPGIVQADLTQLDQVKEALRPYHIGDVIHLAALTNIPDSQSDPAWYYWNNVSGSLNLLEVMRRRGIDRIVFASSSSVYGYPQQTVNRETLPIGEGHPRMPVNPYARSKLMFEYVLADCALVNEIKHVSLRYFNVAGCDLEGKVYNWGQEGSNLIPRVLEVALGIRPEIVINGGDYYTKDGTAVRDYVHVTDVARANVAAMESLGRREHRYAYNVGTGRGYSVREVIEACRRVTGHPIPESVGPRREGDPEKLVAVIEEARRGIAWDPRVGNLDPIVESAWHVARKTLEKEPGRI